MDKIEQKNLEFLKEITQIGGVVNTKISNKRSVDSDDEDFFVAYFFERIFKYTTSFALLIEQGFFHESIIIARNSLEGLFYFFAFTNNKQLATEWRYFGIYEDCEKAYRKAGEDALEKLLTDMEQKFGNEIIQDIRNKYRNFSKIKNGKFCKWHKKDNIRQLIGYDLNLQSLYDQLYSDFSKITHWTPSGVIGGEMSLKSAICISFQCVFEIVKVVNDSYSLSENIKIEKIYNEYLAYNKGKLAN